MQVSFCFLHLKIKVPGTNLNQILSVPFSYRLVLNKLFTLIWSVLLYTNGENLISHSTMDVIMVSVKFVK